MKGNSLLSITGRGRGDGAASRLVLRAGLAAAVSLIALSAAHAQEADQGETVLKRIVVDGGGDGDETKGYIARSSRIGTKTDTPIEKVPQTINVVTREQMDDQQVTSVAESLRYTPGVFTDYRGASNVRDEVFSRGYFYIPRYLDGLLFATAELGQIDPFMLDSVELMKGPSSVLFGQTNPGGLINMTSKKPKDAPYREVTVGFGTNNRASAAFDVSDALNDTIRYRIAAIGLTSDLQEDYTHQQRIAVAPSVSWTPDDATSLTISGIFQHDPEVGYRNFMEKLGTIDKTAYGRVPTDFFVSDPDYEKFTRDQATLGYQFSHEFNDALTFRSSARYTHVDEAQKTLVWGALDSTDGKTISRTASGGRDVVDQFVIDNSLQAKVSTGPANHTFLIGGDYRYRERDYHWGYDYTVPSIDWTDPVYGNLGKIKLTTTEDTSTVAKQLGVYAQDQIEIGKLNLLFGGRYDWATTDIDDHLNGGRTSYNDSAFSYRAGAIYNFDNGISPYASYSTSFEPVIQAAPAGEDPFKPTTARQFEAGIRYAPTLSDFTLTASYFDIEQKNLVGTMWEQDSSGNWTSVSKQMGKTRSRGIELQGTASLTDNLSLLSSYAYIDTKVLTSVDPTLIGNAVYRSPPQHQASLWAKYEHTDGTFNGLGYGAGVRYIGTAWGDEANSFKVPAVTLLDATISYDFGAKSKDLEGLSLQINVKNLADKKYVSSCAIAYACWYGERRSVFGTLKYTW
ncbi:TonB-dependent siderophore receptor [Rhizobium sp. FKL33]|uniref:TonB-dependent siderophore receptor n=1 Tax=Rhizobium sp. FKL33 TaxID=2562307 RepID=UPI0010C02795|nr:TonB-dependent siderophore receptor [Rhizobium sp. FKL33]